MDKCNLAASLMVCPSSSLCFSISIADPALNCSVEPLDEKPKYSRIKITPN